MTKPAEKYRPQGVQRNDGLCSSGRYGDCRKHFPHCQKHTRFFSIVSELTEKQVEFVSLKENIDTTTPQGRFMLTVFGALAELGRENILERQREGIAIAKDEGKYKGRKPLEIDEEQFKDVCARWRAGEVTAIAAMKRGRIETQHFLSAGKEMSL